MATTARSTRKTTRVSHAKPADSATARYHRTDLDGGYITADSQTGLSWSHVLGRATHKLKNSATQLLVDALNAQQFGGHNDWRLPTVEELFLIADRTRVDPAVDLEAFPNTEARWFWSASPCAGNSVYAWGINFSSGNASCLYRSYGGFVRAVRGPVSPRPGQ